jgi:hypothetical protein
VKGEIFVTHCGLTFSGSPDSFLYSLEIFPAEHKGDEPTSLRRGEGHLEVIGWGETGVAVLADNGA